MNPIRIEHVNLTVSKPKEAARKLCRLFDWEIRWQGPSPAGGYTVHVGSERDYLSLYEPPGGLDRSRAASMNEAGFNHVGVEVEDLDEIERRVREEGLTPRDFDDYDPGRRFYFTDDNGIDFEVVEYAR